MTAACFLVRRESRCGGGGSGGGGPHFQGRDCDDDDDADAADAAAVVTAPRLKAAIFTKSAPALSYSYCHTNFT